MSDTGEFELPSIQDIADDALHFGDAAGHFGQDIADGSIAGAVTHAVASDMVTHVVDLGHDASAYRGAGGPLEAAAAKVDFANDMAAIKTDSELLSDFASGETPYTSMHLPDGGEGGGSGTASATAASSEPEFYGDDGAAGGGGTISTTVYPDGSSVSSVDGGDPVYTPAGAYDDAGVTTINPDGSMTTTYADGASATVSDGTGIFADSAPTEDVRIGGYQLDITPLADAWGEANDVAQELMDSGVPIGAAVGLAEALVDGDFEGAAEEVLIGAVDVGADALGLPEIDAGVGFLTDLVEGNTDALLGDAESATIGTVAGLAGATIGSVLGPAGTLLGGEIGGLVGGAVAPSVESVLSDGVGTIEDVGSDTIEAFRNAADDFRDGDLLGGVGDVAGGLVNDVGDVAAGAFDIAGDALEGVGDAVEAVAEIPGDVIGEVEDIAGDVEEGVEDVIDEIGDLF